MLGAVAAATFLLPQASQAACSDPPGIKVDWQGCDKSSANLGGVTLADAKLSGANLTDADLAGANLTDTNFTGATWRDGRKCGPGSFGQCK